MAPEEQTSNPFWDPFGLWRELGRATEEQLSNPTFVMPDLPTTSTPLQWLVDAARSRLVGRRIGFEVGGKRLEFEVDDITLDGDAMLVGAGQAEAITVDANDITWDSHAYPAARAVFRNVHIRPGLQPALLSAPIDLNVNVTARDVADRIEGRVPWLQVEITEEGELRARHRRRAGWGWVRFALAPDTRGLSATLETLNVGSRSWRLPTRLRAIPIPLSLPQHARVTEVATHPESLELGIRFDEHRVDLKKTTSFLSGSKGATEVD